MQARPTSDRLRETLFNVIAPRVAEARWLDLCAGTGAIGIEALSRGASFVTFVDRSRKMCGLVEANLDLCGIPEEQTEVIMSEAVAFLRRAGQAAPQPAPWDIVFFDPPYASDYAQTLAFLGAAPILAPDAVVIVEHHHKNALPDEVGVLRRWRILKQGDSALSFYENEAGGAQD